MPIFKEEALFIMFQQLEHLNQVEQYFFLLLFRKFREPAKLVQKEANFIELFITEYQLIQRHMHCTGHANERIKGRVSIDMTD